MKSGHREQGARSDTGDVHVQQRQGAPGKVTQNGIAIDITTGSFTSALYLWMKANGPTYGFIRTVSGEHWHGEYRPGDAANHGHKMPGVNP